MYQIYIKDEIGNQIGEVVAELPKVIEVESYTITDGMLKIGNYQTPIQNILLIKYIS